MKRILAVVLALVLSLMSLSACAEKFRPEIKINTDSITSIDFKKTYFTDDSDDPRDYKQKTLTEADDIRALADWLTGLHLTEHPAIEIPVEQVSYAIILNGKKSHRVLFMDEYIIYDSTAYTFDRDSDKNAVDSKYNLLGYTETETELDII